MIFRHAQSLVNSCQPQDTRLSECSIQLHSEAEGTSSIAPNDVIPNNYCVIIRNSHNTDVACVSEVRQTSKTAD